MKTFKPPMSHQKSFCWWRDDCIQRKIIIQTAYACQANKIWHQSVAGWRLCQWMWQTSLFTLGEAKVLQTALVLMLSQAWLLHFLTNTDISFDNFFMGIALMDYLLAHNIYAWGTVQVNRKGLPPCAKKKLKQGEMVQAQCGHLLFTKWHEERDVSFVSTNILSTAPTRPVQRKKNSR